MNNPYLQFTRGFNGETFFSSVGTYTDDTTLEAFITNAPEGEFGIFNAATNAVITTALTGSTEWFIAQKIGGRLVRSTKVKHSATKYTKTAGANGTNQVTQVVIKCGGDNSCATCQVDINENYTIGFIDETITDGMEQETWNYYVPGKSGRTIAQAIDALKLKINDTNSLENQGHKPYFTVGNVTVTAPANAGDPTTYTFNITGTDSRPFKLNVDGFCDVVITTTTVASRPVNPIADLIQHDREGKHYGDALVDYVDAPLSISDWPNPPSQATSATGLYTIIQAKEDRSEDSLTPMEKHYKPVIIELIVPNTGTSNSTPTTVFGL